jgi:hypothetical protein
MFWRNNSLMGATMLGTTEKIADIRGFLPVLLTFSGAPAAPGWIGEQGIPCRAPREIDVHQEISAQHVGGLEARC